MDPPPARKVTSVTTNKGSYISKISFKDSCISSVNAKAGNPNPEFSRSTIAVGTLDWNQEDR
jgi:hypothetical protein